MADAITIGKRIKYLRESLNMEREELAEKCGLTERAIESYEYGQRIPRDSIKVELAKHLQTTVQALFYLP